MKKTLLKACRSWRLAILVLEIFILSSIGTVIGNAASLESGTGLGSSQRWSYSLNLKDKKLTLYLQCSGFNSESFQFTLPIKEERFLINRNKEFNPGMGEYSAVLTSTTLNVDRGGKCEALTINFKSDLNKQARNEQLASVANNTKRLQTIKKSGIQTLCRVSLNTQRDDWDNSSISFKDYVDEVIRRGYSVEWCRVALGLPRTPIADVPSSSADPVQSESDPQALIYQNLISELMDFVKVGQPSTDHILFSMSVSKFRTALATTDENLKKSEYDKLIALLETDENYQKYKVRLAEKLKQQEIERQNQFWEEVQSRISFISDYLRRDPLNSNANELGELYIKLVDVQKSKDLTKAQLLNNEAAILFEKLHITKSFATNLKPNNSNVTVLHNPSPETNQNLNPNGNLQVVASASLPQTGATNPSRIRKSALIIGNSNYRFVSKLDNPNKDSDLIATALREAGFETVIRKMDLAREQMITAIQDFAPIADASDWSIIYFAGHGIEFGGTNYVIPIDARLKADRDIEIETVNLMQISRSIEGAKKLKMIILDACRDNPFASQMRRTIAARSIGRGLASVEPEAGTLVVYAAKNGEIAYDGDGENSPFASALVKRLRQRPALEIRRLFDFVRDDVLAATSKKQQPFSYGSLPANEDFFFDQ